MGMGDVNEGVDVGNGLGIMAHTYTFVICLINIEPSKRTI